MKSLVFFYITVTLILIYLPFKRMFPPCYIENYGLTYFKKISEYVISLFFLLTAVLIYKNKNKFDKRIFYYIIFSLILNAVSEIFFTFYISVYGISNIIGHYFKLASYYMLYKAIIVERIKKPFNSIFKELRESQQKFMKQALIDELTGCYNRRACFEMLNKNMYHAKREKSLLTICLIDMDNLKFINDKYGHHEGDKAIKTLATFFRKNNRLSDYICRIGGDEFLIIMPGCSLQDAQNLIQRVRFSISKKNIIKHKIDFSYGFAELNININTKVDAFIRKADKLMYLDKLKKKR